MGFLIWAALLLITGTYSSVAQAGVFNIPQFVTPGEFAIGIEPELNLTNGAGAAVNLKYTHGLSDLTNVQGILGTGGGPRNFRVGANMVFDFFPDIDKQPGIGLAVQGIYYRVTPRGATTTYGQTELTGIPYLHKAFLTRGTEINPFLAVPIGMAFNNGNYKALAAVVVGTMFKNGEHFRYNIELGVSINNAETYFSGGVTYYH